MLENVCPKRPSSTVILISQFGVTPDGYRRTTHPVHDGRNAQNTAVNEAVFHNKISNQDKDVELWVNIASPGCKSAVSAVAAIC